MKLAALSSFLLLLASISIAQPHALKDEIAWSSPSQLTMDDFRKESPGRKTNFKTGKRSYKQLEGFIYCGINFSYESVGSKISYSVIAFMVPGQSWIRDKENPETLLHEQAHFNITEIYARKLRQKLKEIHSTEAAKKAYKKCFAELKKMQDKFDADHEGESGLSPKWMKQIEMDLEKLSAYSNDKVSQRNN